jgi:hypothetical protein
VLLLLIGSLCSVPVTSSGRSLGVAAQRARPKPVDRRCLDARAGDRRL